jgi:hypothetical protein
MMPCEYVVLPGGVHAWIRRSKQRARTCSVCGRKINDYRLCDFVVGNAAPKPRTCDAVLCKACANHREPDTDYCPAHAAAIEGRRLRL